MATFKCIKCFVKFGLYLYLDFCVQSSELEPADQAHSGEQLKRRRLVVGSGPELCWRRRFFWKGINFFSGNLRFSKNVALENCNSEMK